MKKKTLAYSLLLLTLVGLLFHWTLGHKNLATQQPISLSAVESDVIVAPAIIDALSDILHIPTLQSGVIQQINVIVGEKVKKGHPLFSLDSTLAESNVNIYKINLEQSRHGLLIQNETLNHAKYQLERLRTIDKRAISQAELQDKTHEINLLTMQITQTQHSLDLAMANLKNAELALSQFTTIAPKDGIVLQINGHAGEFVRATQPIIFLGDAKKIFVRVSIDERDAQHFQPNAPAYINNDANTALKIPLTS